jgi:nickel-dependent lactate racemase
MHVKLAYGRTGLEIEVPEGADVIRPGHVDGIADEAAALRDALRNPIGTPTLAELVKTGDNVVVVHTDITRATPNDRILPVVLGELESAGVERNDITLLNGLGTHRPQTDVELRRMLGDVIVDNYQCLQHDCKDDDNLVSLGVTSRGNPVRVNRMYLEADVKVLTGFIEPHFFAGFSGGPKAILPSLAGEESVFSNHGARMIGSPKAAWGITEGNPIWEEMREVALMTKPTFLLNVALNTRHEITGIFAGDLIAAHAKGIEFVREHAMAGVDQPYDIVIVTNSGYPLDQNLYQSVKGMTAARQIVREGGAIIMAAACEDGLPDFGGYVELLRRSGSPEKALEMIGAAGFSHADQWQVQIQAQVQLHADVYVYSDGLTDEQIRLAQLTPCRDIEGLLGELIGKFGAGARVCVIPDGPQSIPYLRERVAVGG